MLDRQGHELDWGPRGRLSLLVTEPPADGHAGQVRRAALGGEGWPSGAAVTALLSFRFQEVGPAGGAEAPGRGCVRRGAGLERSPQACGAGAVPGGPGGRSGGPWQEPATEPSASSARPGWRRAALFLPSPPALSFVF